MSKVKGYNDWCDIYWELPNGIEWGATGTNSEYVSACIDYIREFNGDITVKLFPRCVGDMVSRFGLSDYYGLREYLALDGRSL